MNVLTKKYEKGASARCGLSGTDAGKPAIIFGGGQRFSVFPAAMRRAALAALAAVCIVTGCEQPAGAPPPASNQTAGGGKGPAVSTGIAITPPDIIIYAKNQPFDSTGLTVREVFSDGSERVLEGEEYSYTEPNTSVPGPKKVTVTAGKYTNTFNVMVNTSTDMLTGFDITRLPTKITYDFGENIDYTGMQITGHYSGGDKTETVYYAFGYDGVKRGTQSITVKLNQYTRTFDISVLIPSYAQVTLNNNPNASATEKDYLSVYVKGTAVPLPKRLKITVKANNKAGYLSEEDGGVSAADFSGYNPSQTGYQTAYLSLDNIDVEVPLFTIDAEPELFFDYGYKYHDSETSGQFPDGRVKRQYTVPVGTTLIITPIVFFMNTETPSYSWSIQGPANCSTSGPGQKYYHISPSCAAGNVLKATVSVTAGGITKTAEAEIAVTAARPSSNNPPAELTSEIFNQMLPPVLNPGMGQNVSLRNFSPGQFTNGGSGFGWSLGAFGGYEVWKLRRINNNTRNVQISGNPMATWSEPGIVWVSIDDNQNGVPDDTWYELKGSDDDNSSFRNQISRNYAVRYIKPPDYGESENQYGQKISNIYWVDSKGRTGRMHGAWPSPWGVSLDENWVIYSGTNIRDYGAVDGGAGSLMDFVYGYVDAATTGAEWDKFDISWAVKADGTPANLPWIDFVKVQTGTFHYGGAFGEFSTEINYADGLGNQTNFPKPEDS